MIKNTFLQRAVWWLTPVEDGIVGRIKLPQSFDASVDIANWITECRAAAVLVDMKSK